MEKLHHGCAPPHSYIMDVPAPAPPPPPPTHTHTYILISRIILHSYIMDCALPYPYITDHAPPISLHHGPCPSQIRTTPLPYPHITDHAPPISLHHGPRPSHIPDHGPRPSISSHHGPRPSHILTSHGSTMPLVSEDVLLYVAVWIHGGRGPGGLKSSLVPPP